MVGYVVKGQGAGIVMQIAGGQRYNEGQGVPC